MSYFGDHWQDRKYNRHYEDIHDLIADAKANGGTQAYYDFRDDYSVGATLGNDLISQGYGCTSQNSREWPKREIIVRWH